MNRKKIALIGHKSVNLPFVFESAERLGYDIYQVVCKDEAFYNESLCCKDIIELDLFNAPEQNIGQFVDFFNLHALDGVLSMREPLLPWVEQVSQTLNLNHNGFETAIACRDKLIMRAKLLAASIPQPIFHDGNKTLDLVNNVNFPVVVKPSGGAGSIGVIKANNAAELTDAIKLTQSSNNTFLDKESLYLEKGGIIVEEYVHGEELVCDTFSIDGELKYISIGNKGCCEGPYFEKSIYQVPANLDDDLTDKIVQTVSKALLALGLKNGPSHTEFRLFGDIPYIIEVGARIGGSGVPAELVRIASGVELFDVAFKYVTGEKSNDDDFKDKISKFAGNYVIPLGTGGTFSSYKGLEWVKSVDSTQRVVTNYSPGDYIPGYPLCTSYPGFIISEHQSFQEMQRYHQQVADKLYIKW